AATYAPQAAHDGGPPSPAAPHQPNGAASHAPSREPSSGTAERSGALGVVARMPAAGSLAALGDGQVWGRLFQLVRPWWWETMLVFALGPLHAVSQVALGVVGAVLVGQVATGGNLTPWLWGLAALVPVTAVLRWLDSFVSHDLAYRLLAELRIRLYQLLDPLAPAYLVRRRSGDLVSALLGDVELIELFY